LIHLIRNLTSTPTSRIMIKPKRVLPKVETKLIKISHRKNLQLIETKILQPKRKKRQKKRVKMLTRRKMMKVLRFKFLLAFRPRRLT